MSEDTTKLELTVYCSDAKVTQAELDTTDLCHSTAIRRSYEASDNVDDVEKGLTTLILTRGMSPLACQSSQLACRQRLLTSKCIR